MLMLFIHQFSFVALRSSCLQFVACLAFLEFSFYWSHRLLHHPALYARLHKQHHEYKGPIGFAAEYATAGVCTRARVHAITMWAASRAPTYSLPLDPLGCFEAPCHGMQASSSSETTPR